MAFLEVFSVDNIAFTRLIRPSSMRSTYWTYFGFPADEHNQILTRRKVVCTLCNSAIAYNRNTTNLKAHLSIKHPELDPTVQPKVKRVKYVYHPVDDEDEDVDDLPDEGNPMGTDDHTVDDGSIVISELDSDFLIETDADELLIQENMLLENNKDTTEEVKFKVEYVEQSDLVEPDEMYAQSDLSDEIEEMTEAPEEKTNNTFSKDDDIHNAFLDIFISELSTEIGAGNEFRKFCSLLNYVVPDQREIENQLIQHFTKRKLESTTEIETSLITNESFSLGLELWSNIDEELFITVSIFFTSQQSSLNSRILFTIDFDANKDVWKSSFNILELKFCSAAVVNFAPSDVSFLAEIFTKYDIPTFPCFVWIIQRAAEICMDEKNLMVKAQQCLSTEMARKYFVDHDTRPPNFHPQFWQSTYKYLEYVSKFCAQSLDDGNSSMITRIQNVLDVLSPLKIALNTLYTEIKPTASLAQPILQTLLKEHFATSRNELYSSFGTKKYSVQNELNSIVRNHPLIVLTSFLDPRFQSLVPTKDIHSAKDAIQHKLDFLGLLSDDQSNLNVKSITSNVSTPLSVFLGKPAEAVNPKNPRTSRLQVEMFSYNEEVDVTMETCPTEWWHEVGAKSYPNMWNVAKRLTCIPAVIGVKRTSLSERIAFYEKRRLLVGDVKRIDRMVWLYADTYLRV